MCLFSCFLLTGNCLAKCNKNNKKRCCNRLSKVYHSLHGIADNRYRKSNCNRIFTCGFNRTFQRSENYRKVRSKSENSRSNKVIYVFVVSTVCGAVTVMFKPLKIRFKHCGKGVRSASEKFVVKRKISEYIERPYPHIATVSTPAVIKSQKTFQKADICFCVNYAEIIYGKKHCNNAGNKYTADYNRNGKR